MKKLTTEEWVAIVVVIAVGIGFYAFTAGLIGPQTNSTDPNNQQDINMNEDQNNTGELIVTTTNPGTGVEAKIGDSVIVNYRGRLAENRTEFDNSYDRGQPFTVNLGAGEVIPGWEQGLIGAKAGESRVLVIPSDLAYGPNGIPGVIPGGATLEFDIEVIEVISAN